MADESYIRQLQSEINARQSAHFEKTSKENREAKIIKELAPKDWIKLKEWLRDAVTQVNQGNPAPDLTCEDGDSINEAKIGYRLGQMRSEISVTFVEVLSGPITVIGDKARFEFNPSVRGRDLRWTESSNPLMEYTVDEMGKKILNSIVGL